MSVTWWVAHSTPGRIRFRFDGLRTAPALERRLVRIGELVDGIRGVEVKPITGSVLVSFNPRLRGGEEKIIAALRATLGSGRQAPPEAGHSNHSQSAPHDRAHGHSAQDQEVKTIEKTVNEEARLVTSALEESSEVEVATQVIEADARKLAKRSPALAALVAAVRRLNAKVKRATKGVLDLQLLLIFPFALHSLMFRKKDAFFWSVLGLFSVHALINLSTQEAGAGAKS